MPRKHHLGTVALLLIGLSGCENPADHAPKARVTDATVISDKATEPAEARESTAEMLPISPETTRLEFVGSKVTGSHAGGFKELKGTFRAVPEKWEDSRLEAEIDMDSTWSDSDRLTEHLESADFFDVAEYPTSKFVSTEIVPIEEESIEEEGDATHTITGNLTLHGVTKSISFPATLKATDEAVSLQSEFAINRKDFGIEYPGRPDDLIRDEVVIKLSIEAPR